MNITEKDKSYLWDISEACKDIISFTNNITKYEFSEDKMCRYAVERQLLVIGEASNHLSKEFIENSPQIPWKQIIGLRNIIAHDYGEILVERIWLTVENHIEQLLNNIRTFLD